MHAIGTVKGAWRVNIAKLHREAECQIASVRFVEVVFFFSNAVGGRGAGGDYWEDKTSDNFILSDSLQLLLPVYYNFSLSINFVYRSF